MLPNEERIIKLTEVPDGRAAIVARYGDPEDPDFITKNMIRKAAPFTMRIAWNLDLKSNAIYGHRLVVDSMADALQEIVDYKGHQWLRERNLDLFGGVFANRKMIGYNALSTHAWGIAIDYCPNIGRLGSRADADEYPRFIVKAFTSRGFDWGGAWPAKYQPDAMHFQACTGY